MDDTITIIDLGEATALHTLGFILRAIETCQQPPNAGKYKVFIFDTMHPNSSTINVDDTLDNYRRRRLQVDAYSFYRTGRELKTEIWRHTQLENLH